jgi:hypothetical protein
MNFSPRLETKGNGDASSLILKFEHVKWLTIYIIHADQQMAQVSLIHYALSTLSQLLLLLPPSLKGRKILERGSKEKKNVGDKKPKGKKNVGDKKPRGKDKPKAEAKIFSPQELHLSPAMGTRSKKLEHANAAC